MTVLQWLEVSGWALPPTVELVRLISRLLSATVLGAVVGFEREARGMSAGLRTHMLVALGTAVFTLVPLGEEGASGAIMSEIVKGVAAGIGFLGAGTILKRKERGEIQGLTTASSIWLTSAVGLACGAGRMWLASFTVVLSLLILYVLHNLEQRLDPETS